MEPHPESSFSRPQSSIAQGTTVRHEILSTPITLN